MVYRMNKTTRKKEAAGCIVDRRRTQGELRQRFVALLVEARDLFGEGQGDEIEVVLEPLAPAAVPKARPAERERAAAGMAD